MNYQPQETRSRLSKTVDQVLQDNLAMPHYTHFMEHRGADHLVLFWLEAEGFRSSSWSRVRAQSLNSVKHSSLAEPVAVSPHGTELIQNVPNDLARSSNSVGSSALPDRRDSSSSESDLRPNSSRSETPSRKTPSRTGTPSKGQPNRTLRELSDQLMKSESALNTLVIHVLVIV